MKKIDKVFLLPINEANFKSTLINKDGIKCSRITIPINRCGINDWFQKFTI